MVKPGETKKITFFNPFRTAECEIGETFGRFSIKFEGIGGAFSDLQALTLFLELLEYLKAKDMVQFETVELGTKELTK